MGGVPLLALALLVLLPRAAARAVRRGGGSSGVDNEGDGGTLDSTSIIVLGCFGALAVIFLAFGTWAR
jgi:hypothetical protein